MNDFPNQPQRDIQFSKKVRAGKRTYYFDVKSTRNSDLYMTITESKRLPGDTDATPIYEKHKLFLYKEDFAKFKEGLMDALEYIKGTGQSEIPLHTVSPNDEGKEGSSFSDVDFDDLGK